MIKSVSISNFRSIYELTDLKFGDTTFIIGRNGAGKSTLISALYLTKQLSSKKGVEEILNQLAPFGYELFTTGSRNSSCQINLTVRDEKGINYKFSYAIAVASPIGYRITNESLIRLEHGDKEITIYERSNDQFRAVSKKSKSLEDVPLNIASTDLVLGNYSNDEVNRVARLISGYKILWFDKTSDPAGFKVHTQDKLDNANLDATVVSLYITNPDAFKKAVHVIKQLIPEFEAPVVRKITPNNTEVDDKNKLLDRYIVFWNEKEAIELEYTITGLSDGNFRIIQLIFALFSSEKSTCLVGEEIENGQHYGRIKTLLETLKVLSAKLNVQLIFTTHSRDLLRSVSPNDVIYCWKDDKGHSLYQYLDEKVNTSMVEEELGSPPTAKDVLDLGMV